MADSFRQSLGLSQISGSDVVASDHYSFRRHEQTFDGGGVNFWQLPDDQDEAAAQSSSCAARNARHRRACSWSISKPLVMVVFGTLGPLITLLTIISCHRFTPTGSMFEAGKHTSEGGVLFV